MLSDLLSVIFEKIILITKNWWDARNVWEEKLTMIKVDMMTRRQEMMVKKRIFREWVVMV